jgi:ubiquinone/menaquinone biosynthesis C-methylase UbiE
MAWTYDWVASTVSLGRWKNWVFALLPHLQQTNILELGHGPGHLQAEMRARGYFAVGLDESSQMGVIAYKRLHGLGYEPLLVNGYAQSLPFPSRCFQQVVATFPSEYIAQVESLDEINRVLLPEGELLILPVAWITGGSPLLRAAAWLFRVTGQSPDKEKVMKDERIEKLFQTSHFNPEFIERKFEDSTVLIIKAVKMNAVTL